MELDQVTRLLEKEIKNPIRLLHGQMLAGSVPALIFWGIDTLSNVSRPKDKEENTRSDFKSWFAKYVMLQDPDVILTPEDWYSARCAVLHTSTPDSKDTKSQTSKTIVYAYEGNTKHIYHRRKKAVAYNEKVDPHMVVVSIDCLIDAFFEGIDKFVSDVFADPDLEPLFEKRIKRIFVTKSI